MEIRLNNLVPLPLRNDCAGSEVWNREIVARTGEMLFLLAQSGKGKTTLLSLLFGLRQDYQGQIAFDGADIRAFGRADWSRIRTARLSLMFQDLQLFDELTAVQNVEIKNSLTQYKTEPEIATMFGALGLAEMANRPVGTFSQGQKQRVAIIRALCQPFEFLLLDEPFSHLDRENREIASKLMREESGKQRAGIIQTGLEQEQERERFGIRILKL